MIRLENISKIFHIPDNIILFDKFNFEIRERDFVIVIGSNGSGKSTLLNIIAGTVKADDGSIRLDEKEIQDFADYHRSKWISRIFQNPLAGTAPELTILENFRLASLRTKRKGLTVGTNDAFRKTAKDKLSILNLGLENKLDQLVGSLSGGQRQSLSLLMAIADDTKLLLMDEPTAALDPRTSDLVMNVAEKVISEFSLTALLVTHQLKHALQYGNRIVQLREGHIQRDIRKDTEHKLTLGEVYEWFE